MEFLLIDFHLYILYAIELTQKLVKQIRKILIIKNLNEEIKKKHKYRKSKNFSFNLKIIK